MRRAFTIHSCIFVISLLLINSSISIKLSNQETRTSNETLCQLSAALSSFHSDEFDNATLSDKCTHVKTDLSPSYGDYDRLAAYYYAQKYWDEVCSDGYFVNTRTTYIPLDPGTDITGMTGYDCAHFVSCCIGIEPHEPGGGLNVPNTAPHIYGELGATQLGDWLITSGNGVEKPAISELMMGDVINYDWDGDGHWDHAALYIGNNEVAGHTTCVWEVDWQLIGAVDYRFVHIPASPWIVDDDGSADFHTIQEAINAASDGDTIFVWNGTYYENIVVNKSITLIGENKHSTTIDGSGAGTVVQIISSNVTISRFTIHNGGAVWPGSSLWLNGSNHSIISHNVIRFNSWYGIGLNYSNSVTIDENVITNNDRGVWIVYSNNCTVKINHVSENLRGICVQSSMHCMVVGNIANNNTYDGIILYKCNENVLFNNTLLNNNVGIKLEAEGNGNHIIDNTVYGNTIDNNTMGIWFGAAQNNHIYNNNFFSNTQQIYHYDYNINNFDNGCEGNFWSDYVDNDTNGDGIGDTPYIIDETNQDNYPLMNLYWNPADINHDLTIDIFDVVTAAIAYMSTPEDLHWNCHCDIGEPYRIINIFDIVMICTSYSEEWS
jgi:nitrous oxidase accessory protein